MPLKRTKKKNLIKKHQAHTKDTGSAPVQIAILTSRIEQVTKHLQEHKKDNDARKGLLGMVAQRRKLLTYLKMNEAPMYQSVIEAHGLKR